MTKHLSSAAQAVLESTARQVLADRRINMEHIAAAALRAAEDQISSNADPGHGEWSDGYYEGVQETCLKILAIAAELEGHHG